MVYERTSYFHFVFILFYSQRKCSSMICSNQYEILDFAEYLNERVLIGVLHESYIVILRLVVE